MNTKRLVADDTWIASCVVAVVASVLGMAVVLDISPQELGGGVVLMMLFGAVVMVVYFLAQMVAEARPWETLRRWWTARRKNG